MCAAYSISDLVMSEHSVLTYLVFWPVQLAGPRVCHNIFNQSINPFIVYLSISFVQSSSSILQTIPRCVGHFVNYQCFLMWKDTTFRFSRTIFIPYNPISYPPTRQLLCPSTSVPLTISRYLPLFYPSSCSILRSRIYAVRLFGTQPAIPVYSSCGLAVPTPRGLLYNTLRLKRGLFLRVRSSLSLKISLR
jgi:hypothetical protein